MKQMPEHTRTLARLNAFSDMDRAFAEQLAAMDPDSSEEFVLAACLVSHAYRQGHVCLNLGDYAGKQLFPDEKKDTTLYAPELSEWLSALRKSRCVGSPGDFRPLVLDSVNRLYLQKLWRYEQELAVGIIERCRQRNAWVDTDLLRDGLGRLYEKEGRGGPDWQKIASATALYRCFTIITGGPGTGKTWTVLNVLALYVEQCIAAGKPPSVALVAPTGKAAARLKQSIAAGRDALDLGENVREAIPQQAATIHQLLGARRGSATFRFNAENRLPHGLVVVDEASMVDQALMYRLLKAVREDAILILLGDKDQLASVEAGSVLGDLCRQADNRVSSRRRQFLESAGIPMEGFSAGVPDVEITDHIVHLTRSYRFGPDSGIAQLLNHVNRGDAERAHALLKDEAYPEISIEQQADAAGFERSLRSVAQKAYVPVIRQESVQQAFDHFNRIRILAAHRRGPLGVEMINPLIQDHIMRACEIPRYREWYRGKAVMIKQNDYSNRLNNGDIGICWPDDEGAMKVYFEKEGGYRAVDPARLPSFDLAYAQTVHKSQGSEFEDVLFILPSSVSRILSRELVYTALSRARRKVTIWGEQEIFAAALSARIRRTSALYERLREEEERG